MSIDTTSGKRLWAWYFEISQSVTRVRHGICEPIPPSEFVAWSQITCNMMRHEEYSILRGMDVEYCDVVNQELKDYRAREEERTKRART